MKIPMVNLPIIFEKAAYIASTRKHGLWCGHIAHFVFEVLNETLRDLILFISFISFGFGFFFFSFHFEPSFMASDEVKMQQNHHFM